MHAFSPYVISHIQVPDVVRFSLPAGNAYLVFWWQKIPLGHLWLQAETPVASQAAFLQNVLAAIDPALHYYLSGSPSNAWQASFLNGNAALLQQLLQSNALLQTFSKPHVIEKRLSVVICTRNRTAALKHCIEALNNSIDKDFELVIVDNAPDSNSTEKLVQQFDGLRYVREARKGLSYARNTGVAQASGDLIAFTDDDVLVEEGWTAKIKKAFADVETMCVTGLVIPLQLATKAAYIFEKYWSFNRGYVPLVFDQAYFSKHKDKGVPVWEIGAGANMAFRKSIFQHIGLFDERLGAGAAGCSEDSELWYRILAEGFTCRYFPQLYVLHQHRGTQPELNKQLFSYMRGHISALYIQHERYKHKGNRYYLRHVLPAHFVYRLKQRLHRGPSLEFDSFFTELRGCFSGWRFYKNHRKKALP